MEKIFRIGWKDVLLLFSNPTSLVLMLLAPFVLTMAMGAVTGGMGGSSNEFEIDPIPIALFNEDEGVLGDAIETAFGSEELAELLQLTAVDSQEAARQLVEDDQVAAAVIIPSNFSVSIIPQIDRSFLDESVTVELYANPTRPIGAGIVSTVLNSFLGRIQFDIESIELIINQMREADIIQREDIDALAATLSQQFAVTGDGDPLPQLIALQKQTVTGETDESVITPLSTLAPGLAIFFLIYTVITGGRSILNEWEEGTIPRLLTTPTAVSQILAGKTLGIFLSGFLQVGVLLLAATLLFGVKLGDPVGILLLVVAVVLAATGWGLLLAGLGRTSGQVAAIGSAMMLIFGILGGSLAQIPFSGLMKWISYLTPNAWATEGFARLADGRGVAEILPIAALLLGMTAVLYIVSVLLLQKRWAA